MPRIVAQITISPFFPVSVAGRIFSSSSTITLSSLVTEFSDLLTPIVSPHSNSRFYR